MAHIRVSFMELCENGKAPWVACRDADTVYINALWFKRDTAAALLGMTRPDSGKPAVSDSHLLFFATKLLFASALDRLPDATFGPGMYQYTHRHVSPSIQDQLMQLQNEPKHLRQLCVDRAISRIQNYLSLDGAVVLDEAHHDNRPAVRVSWFVGQYAGVGKDIAIQCHHLEPGEQYLVVMVLDPDDKFAIANATALYTAPSDATPAE
ncbi:hypothetical protein SCUCBS95973_009864 [Sporothrix curviconia]|uniref:Uncharacterized protein n=1 Tax=Sporothrix curviconia TaxID=1260050 RepID=A0ABP0CYF1_9PEZI